MNLLFGDELRDELSTSLSNARSVTILSAYFTLPAIDMLLETLPTTSYGRIVVRARPNDLLSGATDLRAIKKAFDNGIPCHINRGLHAKLYIIDNDFGWVGSSNFTSNGLKISGYGNIELSTRIPITEKELKLVRSIINDSIVITKDIIENLDKFLSDNVEIDGAYDEVDWWDDILSLKSYRFEEGLFVTDLPWCNPSIKNSHESMNHDNDVFFLKNKDKLLKLFNRSKIYQFLLQKLRLIESREAYFGQITEWIHLALKDDVLPYRSEVKEYVANLFVYIQLYGGQHFIIDRPNYSQRIRLKNE
ncbi:phospholipase D-like domain-containing protein [Photobacterium damselae]|uniref:phospholipase D-like domain-containing protein n=1 Tax=Photobacterium damselae TaxID=38293 RepID=UPI0040680008